MINTLDLDYKHLKRTRRVNGERVIEFTVFPTKENKQYFDLIVEEAIVTFKDDEYVIKKLEEKSIGETYFKQVTAIHKFYVDLINKQQPRIHNGSITFRDYMHMVFEDTPYDSFTIEDSFAARQFENLGNDNRLALLQKGLDRFKAEMAILPISYKPIFKIEVGEETDFQFRYGHNIKSISKNIDTTNLATKIAGTGDPELGITASYTSPNIAIFGEIDAPPVNDERFKSNETLLEEMKARLIDEPEVSITLDFVDLRAAGYPYDEPREGNKVWLIYEPMDDLLIETRILEVVEVYNPYGDVISTEVTLSNHRGTFAGSMFDNTQKQLSNLEANQNKKIQQAIDSADGKNTNYYGANEPVPPVGGFKKGDLWFKVVDGEYTQTWRYDGDDWVLIVDLYSKQIEEEAEAARQRADDAYDRANQSITDAQVAFDKAQDGFDRAVEAMGKATANADDIVTIQTNQGSIYTRIESAEYRLDGMDGDDRNLITHLPENWEDGSIDSEGELDNSSDRMQDSVRMKKYYRIDGNQELSLRGFDFVFPRIALYTKEKDYIESITETGGEVTTFSTPSNVYYFKVAITAPLLGALNQATPENIGSKIKVKMNKGDSVGEWSPNYDDTGQLVVGVQRFVSEFEQTASSLANRITDNQGNISTLVQTVDGFQERVENAEGDISSVTQLATGLQSRVENAEGDISSVTQLANTIQSRVGKIEDGTASVITQLKDNINARVVKGDVVNQINIDTSGVLISGKKLILDGDTTVNGSFKVTNANITSLDAGKITTGTFDAAQASIINLSANSISGGVLMSQNVMSFFDLNNGRLYIGPLSNRIMVDNTGLKTSRDGVVTSKLDEGGHHFYRDNKDIGYIGTQEWHTDPNYRGLAFGLEYDADYMAWGRKTSSGASTYTTMLSWHRTGSKSNQGFKFSDDVTFDYDVKLDTLRTNNSSSRVMSLENVTFNGYNGVGFLRGTSWSGLFATTNRVMLLVPQSGGSSLVNPLELTFNSLSAMQIWSSTSSNSANVRVSDSGRLYRTSSASKYKLLIEDEEDKGYCYESILDLKLKSWYDKNNAESYAKYLDGNLSLKDADSHFIKRHFGLIAEDVEGVGLTPFVTYGIDGQVESIEYDRLWTLLIPNVRDNKKRLDQYDKCFNTIENRIKNLEKEIAQLKGAS